MQSSDTTELAKTASNVQDKGGRELKWLENTAAKKPPVKDLRGHKWQGRPTRVQRLQAGGATTRDSD